MISSVKETSEEHQRSIIAMKTECIIISGHLLLKNLNHLLRRNTVVEVYLQHPAYHPPSTPTQHYPRVIISLKDRLQVRIHAPLLLYYLRKQAPLYCEKTLLLQPGPVFPGDQQRQAHPKRNPYHDLQNDTSETPHVNCPGLAVVSHHLLIELLLIFSSVLVNDIVEDLRRHVLRSRH